MPIYRSGNSFSDTRAGTVNAELAKVIKALTVGSRRRVTGKPLDPAPVKQPIGPERKVVPRDVGGDPVSGGGPVSPLVEQRYAGSTYYQRVSSNGLYAWEFGHEATLIDADGTGSTFVIKRDNPAL